MATDQQTDHADAAAGDVHALAPAAFLEEVHSFEFWFQSVEGYLSGTQWGHQPDTAEEPLSGEDRERLISLLCNYCIGETAALEAAGGLVAIAPDRLSKVFLSTQVADEGRHLEVFLHRLRELGVFDPEKEIELRGSPSLLEFKRRLLELVEGKDWETALFAQNVVLESLEFVVFSKHAGDADAITAEVLENVIKDERRHMGFGENELGRRFAASPDSRRRLRDFRPELDHLIIATLADTVRHLGISRQDENELARSYLESVGRLGLL
jgi:1,2-phenylacetyl-CoA epoxidase catalytic subunit